jgi:hypothetical protein
MMMANTSAATLSAMAKSSSEFLPKYAAILRIVSSPGKRACPALHLGNKGRTHPYRLGKLAQPYPALLARLTNVLTKGHVRPYPSPALLMMVSMLYFYILGAEGVAYSTPYSQHADARAFLGIFLDVEDNTIRACPPAV